MALPDNPLTRGEQYLNRIATGEGTIPDAPLTRIEQYLAYIAENGGGGGGSDPSAVKKISLSDLPNVGNGTYTLGVVDVTDPIQFPRVQNRGVIIVDTVFNINTPVLFPAYRDDTYFSMPSFVGCTFKNATTGRVLVCSGSTDLVGNRCTGCNFINVDFAQSAYIQDCTFVSCYIQSNSVFLDCPNSTVQARFVGCSAESECQKIVDADKAFVYASGVYEGNGSKSYYFFNATYGTFTFENTWIESSKLLNLVGGNAVANSSTINISGCEVQANSTPIIAVTNPAFVHLNINGSFLVPFNNQAIFINKSAAQLASVTGDFTRSSSDGYVKPIGGVLAEDRKIATIADVNALDTKRFFYQRVLLNAAAIADGGVSLTLPTGRWVVIAGRGYSAGRVELVFATTENATTAGVLHLVPTTPSNDVYVSNMSFTATKAAGTDTTFTLKVQATEAAFYEVSAIKID